MFHAQVLQDMFAYQPEFCCTKHGIPSILQGASEA